ncbi:MAG: GTPase HflX [Christensenellales bacterium]
MVSGNTQGLKKSVLDGLEKLMDFPIERGCFATLELLEAMAALTEQCGREVAVYIARDGDILEVYVGTNDRVSLPMRRIRRGLLGLSGVRCIHTHPGGSSKLSVQDEQTLKELWLDAMAAVGVQGGRPVSVSAAVLDGENELRYLDTLRPEEVERSRWMRDVQSAQQKVRRQLTKEKQRTSQRAFLVSRAADGEASLEELRRLAQTAGAQVAGKLALRVERIDPAYFIGRGRLEEVGIQSRQGQADMVIFNDELSGMQTRNLEEALGLQVVDRTALILDIFASRAQSREGRLQVELAQQVYRLPRLTGLGTVLSRLGGGIGTRGPGEKQLEISRRHIRRRIAELQRELALIRRQREVRRAGRRRSQIPVAALVGYTNAGKSTLLNKLTGSEVSAQDRLFDTLDAVSRRVKLPGDQEILLVDTVGFIRKLPHELVRAFRATLEEVTYADVLLHVIDASDENWPEQKAAVEQVLESLEVEGKPVIHVFNKMDRVPAEAAQWLGAEGVPICAASGEGLDALLQKMAEATRRQQVKLEILLPHNKGALRARLHDAGQVSSEEFVERGARMQVVLDETEYNRLSGSIEPYVKNMELL